MQKWYLQSIDIHGGFLGGLNLTFPEGLTCIIGPRGSGKSTLVEAIRYAMSGTTDATKRRLDIIQGNLSKSTITCRTAGEDGVHRYTVHRSYKQSPSVTTIDGRGVSVDLDRGTLLPLDGYSTHEIENIAEELGGRRRALLDDLIGDELRNLNVALSDHRRALAANADRIRSLRELIDSKYEHVQELTGAHEELASLPEIPTSRIASELTEASRQQRANRAELSAHTILAGFVESLDLSLTEAGDSVAAIANTTLSIEGSANLDFTNDADGELQLVAVEIKGLLEQAQEGVQRLHLQLTSYKSKLKEFHTHQLALLANIQEANAAESQLVTERAVAETRVLELEELEESVKTCERELLNLLEERKELKLNYLMQRDRISEKREGVAAQLQSEIGKKVRLKVMRGADDLAYIQTLTESLKGAGVRNHESLLAALRGIRPEELSQMILENDYLELDRHLDAGPERSRRILSTFREKIDPLALEVTPVDDNFIIELNVGTELEPHYKDASSVSQGQKCTALLPLLIARRNSPILIDQPEDNLDNHFIYETVVDTIKRARLNRQMIFVTHNANIPVLGDADLVIVLESDASHGFVRNQGSLNACRNDIIDLLEGGRTAFELRRKKYDVG